MDANGRPSALDRIVQQALGAERTLGCASDPAVKKFPTLWDWLARIYLGKDHVKQPATLSIRLGPEGVLVTLTDRDLAVSFDVACSSLTEAFAAMETALTSLSPPMRSWGKKEPSLRKRRQSG